MIEAWLICSTVLAVATFIAWGECKLGDECFVVAIGSLAILLGPVSLFIALLGVVFFLLYQVVQAWKESYRRVCEKFKELDKK